MDIYFYLLTIIVVSHVGTDLLTSVSCSSEQLHRFKSLDRILNRLDGINSKKDEITNDLESDDTVSPSGHVGGVHKPWDVRPSKILQNHENHDHDEDDEDNEDDDDFDDTDSYEDSSNDDSELLADRSMHNWPPPTVKPHQSQHYLSYNGKNHGNIGGYGSSGGYTNRHYKIPTTMMTTTTTQKPTTTRPQSYSQFKWQNFGTRQAIEQYRRNALSSSNSNNNPDMSSSGSSSSGMRSGDHHQQRHYSHHHTNTGRHHPTNGYSSSISPSNNRRSAQPLTPEAATRAAIDHALRVSREGSCSVPKSRLVRVQEFYPHPGKTYVPACTILHQCSDDTGCCRNDDLTCSPKTTQRVELSFYTMDNSGGSSVERLVFYNHTECECRDKMDDMMPRDSSPTVSSGYPDPDILPYVSKNSNNYGTHLHETTIISNPKKASLLGKNSQCKCPSAFTERYLPDGSCSCDCFDKQKECLKLKRGKDFFSMQDKWCVKSGRCEIPECSYGQYMLVLGSCPRRKDPHHHHPHNLWNHHRYLST